MQYLSTCSLAVSFRNVFRDWFNCLASNPRYIHHGKLEHRSNQNIFVANDTTLPCSPFVSLKSRADDKNILSNTSDITEKYAAPVTCEIRQGRAVDVSAPGYIVSKLLTILALLAPADPWRMQRWEDRRATFLTPQNLPLAIEWTSKLRLQAVHSSAAARLLVFLDACEAMMSKYQEIQPATMDTAMKGRRLSYSTKDRGRIWKKDTKASAVVVDHTADKSADRSETSKYCLV